jgi:hypothetical protein
LGLPLLRCSSLAASSILKEFGYPGNSRDGADLHANKPEIRINQFK